MIANRTTVKAYRLQDKADEWAAEVVDDYRKKGVRGIGKIYTANISALAINVLPLFGCAIVGAWLLFRGFFSAEGFVSAVMLASVATEELLALPNIMVNFPSGVVAADRLFELWDLPAETGGEEAAVTYGGAVVFDNVTFRYPEQDEKDPPLLDGLCFSVNRGEKVALVGIPAAAKYGAQADYGAVPPARGHGGGAWPPGEKLGSRNPARAYERVAAGRLCVQRLH